MILRPVPGVGDKLGRYTLLKSLATGGMGEVYVAAKTSPIGFGPFVAVKVLRDELAVDHQFVDMLVDEANIAKHLNHQNLVSVIDLGEDRGSYYIAMEFVRGITAERLIESLVEQGRRLDVPLAIHIGIELCRGLRYAHTRTNESGEPLGIVHRDVTPANILLSTEGEVKLTDFGIARAIGRIHQTQAGVIKGKFGYMAPEMVRYEKLDARADLFCVGVVLYLLASGHHPVARASVMEAIHRYEAKQIQPPSEINPAVPPDLDRILMKALEPQPSRRWQSAEELGSALRSVVLSHPEWRSSTRAAASGLASRVREVAPEVFAELVPRDTMSKVAAENNIPMEGLSTGANLSAPKPTTAKSTAPPPWLSPTENEDQQLVPVLNGPTPQWSGASSGRLEEPELPSSRRNSTVRWSDLGDTNVQSARDKEQVNQVGPSMMELKISAGSQTMDGDAPTMVPMSAYPSAEGDRDQGHTLLEEPKTSKIPAVSSPGQLALPQRGDSFGNDRTYLRSPPESADCDEPTFPKGIDTSDLYGGTDKTYVRNPVPAPMGSSNLTEDLLDEPPQKLLLSNSSPRVEAELPQHELSKAPTSSSLGRATSLGAELQSHSFSIPSAARVPISGDTRELEARMSISPGRDRMSSLVRAQPNDTIRFFTLVGLIALATFIVGGLAYAWFFTQTFWPELQIKTNPPEAIVRIDGVQAKGLTPLTVRIAPGKRHRIEINAEGYKSEIREIANAIGRLRTYVLPEVDLKRMPPTLKIKPVPARVFVNGKAVGRGKSIRLRELPTQGPIKLRVSAPSYESFRRKFESYSDVPTSLDVELQRLQ